MFSLKNIQHYFIYNHCTFYHFINKWYIFIPKVLVVFLFPKLAGSLLAKYYGNGIEQWCSLVLAL